MLQSNFPGSRDRRKVVGKQRWNNKAWADEISGDSSPRNADWQRRREVRANGGDGGGSTVVDGKRRRLGRGTGLRIAGLVVFSWCSSHQSPNLFIVCCSAGFTNSSVSANMAVSVENGRNLEAFYTSRTMVQSYAKQTRWRTCLHYRRAQEALEPPSDKAATG
ncbi:hypothetical protein B0H19DRAFT_1085902 [Mycena capillaripes]|nr:hypothetical protein B0H19DRAFT_1085902 [Mycena capillaripes]